MAFEYVGQNSKWKFVKGQPIHRIETSLRDRREKRERREWKFKENAVEVFGIPLISIW